MPYWAARLRKSELIARQLSARGGELTCKLRGDRVFIAGRAVEYLRGEITVEIPNRDSPDPEQDRFAGPISCRKDVLFSLCRPPRDTHNRGSSGSGERNRWRCCLLA